MPFAPGDHVHVGGFGTGFVREVRNGARYVVELKGRAMVVDEAQLTAAEGRKGRPKPGGAPVPSVAPVVPVRAHAPTEIDLHGMTAAEAEAALDLFLNEAILAGHAEVRVIHGRSGGRLKSAVHQRLRALPSVRSFRLDPANAGVTIVTL